MSEQNKKSMSSGRPKQPLGLSIWLFKILDDVLHKHRVSMREWAEVSGVPASRISELRKLFMERALASTQKRVTRAFSVQKCYMLTQGLISIIGRDAVQNGVGFRLDRYQTELTEVEEMIMEVMIMSPSERKLNKTFIKGMRSQRKEHNKEAKVFRRQNW